MVAVASKWQERLRVPQMWQETWPTGVSIISQPANSIKITLIYESNDYLKDTYHDWTKTYELRALCHKQNKQNRRFVRISHALCTLRLTWKTHQKHMVSAVLHIQEKWNIPLETKLDIWELWCLCSDLCDVQSAVCWTNSKKVFQMRARAPMCLEQTR